MANLYHLVKVDQEVLDQEVVHRQNKMLLQEMHLNRLLLTVQLRKRQWRLRLRLLVFQHLETLDQVDLEILDQVDQPLDKKLQLEKLLKRH